MEKARYEIDSHNRPIYAKTDKKSKLPLYIAPNYINSCQNHLYEVKYLHTTKEKMKIEKDVKDQKGGKDGRR